MSPLLADLAGKSFLITGASSGIGAATARLLGRAASLASVDTRGELSLRLAQALVAAGRGAEAADVALPAAEGRRGADTGDDDLLGHSTLLGTEKGGGRAPALDAASPAR